MNPAPTETCIPETSGNAAGNARTRAAALFPELAAGPDTTDALCLDAGGQRLLGWAGLTPWRPIVRAALNHPRLRSALLDAVGNAGHGLLRREPDGIRLYLKTAGHPETVDLADDTVLLLAELLDRSGAWPGDLTQDGDHVFDPRTPAPGTHFRANLLIGDRAGFENPLLTTPKAVVTEWGGGSSRSHSDKQILATRWDVVPEENGFPANRQFYLVENSRQIFFSGAPQPGGSVSTRHAANRTVITHDTACGFRLTRTIFVVPASDSVPCALEAQLIEIENRGLKPRHLDIVAVGMLGFPHPGALTVDVIYSCITVEPRILRLPASGALAVAPHYTPGWSADDQPFSLTLAYDGAGRAIYPSGYSLDYRRFIGNGSLLQPENLACLDNECPRKGPAFFATRCPVAVPAGGRAECHTFNGLMSRRDDGAPVTDEALAGQVERLVELAADPGWARGMLASVTDFQVRYRSAVQVRTPRGELNRLLNVHLPFQIRYQTYASRSFGLTQKGFRQIGFREIQDLFAAMPFELAAGREGHLCDLLGSWVSHVHRFGYADHQFYSTGVEPGRYSDDALWLFQAVGRFADLTGKFGILDGEWPVAGEEGSRRSLYETLKAAFCYSSRISIGRNGLPLLDHADWNDTLNLDGEGIHGPQKEALYRRQIAEGLVKEGEPLQSDLSESVMNGFLLELARQYLVRFAQWKGDRETVSCEEDFGHVLRARLQAAWRGDFFARAFINRPNKHGITCLGGAGDGLSDDPGLPGTYFLNSFSWAVLSGVASDEQVAVMLEKLENVLMTPVGLRISSPVRFRLLMPHDGSGAYAYGDRENGGVFKHANMMAAAALVKAAREVRDRGLAARAAGLAGRILELAAPYATLKDPFVLAGNPRFCTQYTNPATGEHIGPLLSGTAPWMWLAWLEMLGIRFGEGRVMVDPVLPAEWESVAIDLNHPAGRYQIALRKPRGFLRARDGAPRIRVDGRPGDGVLPAFTDGAVHMVDVHFTQVGPETQRLGEPASPADEPSSRPGR
ncbi:MAG: glycosyl transferase [Kiritimatiellae bacterium]|nr:glycosyl transferase [Kiritimatiellia bacterium]